MKVGLLFFIVFGLYQSGIGQSSKNLDIVILINNDLAMYHNNIVLKFQEDTAIGTVSTIQANYHPGNLSIKQEEFVTLNHANCNTIRLEFSYYRNTSRKNEIYNYQFDLSKDWLLGTYLVLRVYNLDVKKYRKRYDPVGVGQNYTFEIDSPDTTFRRVIKSRR